MVNFKQSVAVFLIMGVAALPLFIARPLGRFFGYLSWWLQDRNTKITRENLLICFPSMDANEREQLVKKSILSTGELAAETLVIWHREIAWRQEHIKKIHNEDLMFDALRADKGVILLAPHHGNWELLGGHLTKYGSLTSLYQPPKEAYLEKLVVQNRTRMGMASAPANRKGVAMLLAALKNKGILGILPDQCPDQGGEFSPFFGEPAYTMTLVHGLIKRTDCKVLAGFARRVKDGFEIVFVPADMGIYSDDLAESLAAMNKTVEACVAICPEQYQWEYKRFKVEPGGVSTRYKF